MRMYYYPTQDGITWLSGEMEFVHLSHSAVYTFVARNLQGLCPRLGFSCRGSIPLKIFVE